MQQSSVWQAVLGEIELTLSRGNFVTWFKNTSLVSLDDQNIVVAVPNIFIKQQLEKKYNALILDTLKKNGVVAGQITYKIAAPAKRNQEDEQPVLVTQPSAPLSAQAQSNARPNASFMNTVATSSTSAQPSRSLAQSYRQGVNERYTFENFIVGSGNELAFAACQSVAANPGTKYNPLLLYGGVGIGKTHLIQAVGNAVAAHTPGVKVLYISSEQFVQELVDAIRFKKTGDFASHYRTTDVLIVDDVQFIAGKEKMQEEFFHTFNALHQANKQIILTSDKPPRDIPTLEDRLRSRFTWGMSIDMQIPDFETRCAIVQTKANSQNMELPNDVVDYLATNIQTNIRELEGALNQLLAFCEMRALEPTLDIAMSQLGMSKTRPKHLSAKQILERTARHFQVPIDDILGPKRDKDIVLPRQVAMYIMRSELHLSFPKIAHELGRKDHTTAMHSVEKIDKESQYDTGIREAINSIRERLYA